MYAGQPTVTMTDRERDITRLPATEWTALVRKGLRARGFRGSVRKAPGTSYGWVYIRGTANQWGDLTPAEQTIAASAGINVAGSSECLIGPDPQDRIAVVRGLGLA